MLDFDVYQLLKDLYKSGKRKWKKRKERQSRPPSINALITQMTEDIQNLVCEKSFNERYLGNHVLNRIVQATNSEYGFLGVMYEHEGVMILNTLSFSNVAWNLASTEFFDNYRSSIKGGVEYIMRDLENTLFGDVIKKKKPKLFNNYKQLNRNVLPSGHPPIRRFAGIPIMLNETVVTFIGLCNKTWDFTKKDVYLVEQLMKSITVTFYMIRRFNEVKSKKHHKQVQWKSVCPVSPMKGTVSNSGTTFFECLDFSLKSLEEERCKETKEEEC